MQFYYLTQCNLLLHFLSKELSVENLYHIILSLVEQKTAKNYREEKVPLGYNIDLE